MFEVDLVTDAHAGGHDAKVLKRVLGPLEKGVALDVSLVLDRDVLVETGRGAGALDNDRVVDHEFDWHERVDLLRVAAQRDDGVAHGREVHHGRYPGEVLHQYPRRCEGDLARVLARPLAVELGGVGPPGEGFDVARCDLHAVFVT